MLADISSDVDTKRGLYKQALASAESAVALAPQFGDAHAALGALRAQFLDFVDAKAELDRALALAPGSAFVQRLIAISTVFLLAGQNSYRLWRGSAGAPGV
jgi:Flp pilus assembly protein TadD